MTGDDNIEVERPAEDPHFNNLREEYSAVIEEAQRVVNERIYIDMKFVGTPDSQLARQCAAMQDAPPTGRSSLPWTKR